MHHILKTDPAVFQAVIDGAKTYEIRFNDRGFTVGDELLLRETTRTGAEIAAGAALEYTGRKVVKHVGHVLTGYGLADGWCILSFAPSANEGVGTIDTPKFQSFIAALVNNEYPNYMEFMREFIAHIDQHVAAVVASVRTDYEQVLSSHRRLVREIDVMLNGEEGAAKQPSLCDLMHDIEKLSKARTTPAPVSAAPADDRVLWMHTLPDGKLFGGEPQYGYQVLFTKEEAEKELAVFGGTVQEYRASLPSAGAPEAAEYRTCCDHPDCTTCGGHGGFYRMTQAAGAPVSEAEQATGGWYLGTPEHRAACVSMQEMPALHTNNPDINAVRLAYMEEVARREAAEAALATAMRQQQGEDTKRLDRIERAIAEHGYSYIHGNKPRHDLIGLGVLPSVGLRASIDALIERDTIAAKQGEKGGAA